MCSVGVPLPGFPQGIGQRFGILATLWLVQEEAGRAMEWDHSPRWCRALLDGTGALMTELYVQTRKTSSQNFCSLCERTGRPTTGEWPWERSPTMPRNTNMSVWSGA